MTWRVQSGPRPGDPLLGQPYADVVQGPQPYPRVGRGEAGPRWFPDGPPPEQREHGQDAREADEPCKRARSAVLDLAAPTPRTPRGGPPRRPRSGARPGWPSGRDDMDLLGVLCLRRDTPSPEPTPFVHISRRIRARLLSLRVTMRAAPHAARELALLSEAGQDAPTTQRPAIGPRIRLSCEAPVPRRVDLDLGAASASNPREPCSMRSPRAAGPWRSPTSAGRRRRVDGDDVRFEERHLGEDRPQDERAPRRERERPVIAAEDLADEERVGRVER